MLIHGGATRWEAMTAFAELVVFPDARRQRRRYAAVSAVLRRDIIGPNDSVSVEVGARHGKSRNIGNRGAVLRWLILAVLVTVIVLEYRAYTFPVLHEWIKTALHQCGF